MYRQFLPHQRFTSGSRAASVPDRPERTEGKVDLGGTFCMGKCQQGVCVTVDDVFHSVTPETTKEFFEKEILAKA